MESIKISKVPTWLYPSEVYEEQVKHEDNTEITYQKFQNVEIPETSDIFNLNDFIAVVNYSDYFQYNNQGIKYPFSVYRYYLLNKNEVDTYIQSQNLGNNYLITHLNSIEIEAYRTFIISRMKDPYERARLKYQIDYEDEEDESLLITEISTEKIIIYLHKDFYENNRHNYRFILNFIYQNIEYIRNNYKKIESIIRNPGKLIQDNDEILRIFNFFKGIFRNNFLAFTDDDKAFFYDTDDRTYFPNDDLEYILDLILDFSEIKLKEKLRTDFFEYIVENHEKIFEEGNYDKSLVEYIRRINNNYLE